MGSDAELVVLARSPLCSTFWSKPGLEALMSSLHWLLLGYDDADCAQYETT